MAYLPSAAVEFRNLRLPKTDTKSGNGRFELGVSIFQIECPRLFDHVPFLKGAVSLLGNLNVTLQEIKDRIMIKKNSGFIFFFKSRFWLSDSKSYS